MTVRKTYTEDDGQFHLKISDDKSDTNIHIDTKPVGEKTAELICNWCGLPHPVEAAYHMDMIERGKKALAEANVEGAENIKPEQTWTCGTCMLHMMDAPAEFKAKVKTECDHEVPNESQVLPSTFFSPPEG